LFLSAKLQAFIPVGKAFSANGLVLSANSVHEHLIDLCQSFFWIDDWTKTVL